MQTLGEQDMAETQERAGLDARGASATSADADESFGWRLVRDRQHNLVYYLHGYTGEVRWPRPETVGFVMHGLKPLPAQSGVDTTPVTSVVNPDVWSPYYPHVVMLPSGLVLVHPDAGASTHGPMAMTCNYNRFPLAHFATAGGNEGVDGGGGLLGRPHVSSRVEDGETRSSFATTSSGARLLPPTWEDLRSGSPFLPPFPVAILGSETPASSPSLSPSQSLQERFHTPDIELEPELETQLQGNSAESGSRWERSDSEDSSSTTSSRTSAFLPVPPPEQRGYRPAVYGNGYQPSRVQKEHNRKGYMLRQSRKMRRAGAQTTPGSAAPLKPGTRPILSATSNARLQHPSGRDRRRSEYEYDAVSPLLC